MDEFKGSFPKPERSVTTEVPTISYEEAGILEHDIGDLTYRIDSGKQDTALALSSRPVGAWDWAFVAELKWDGRDLKCKTLDFETRRELGVAFRQALEHSE